MNEATVLKSSLSELRRRLASSVANKQWRDEQIKFEEEESSSETQGALLTPAVVEQGNGRSTKNPVPDLVIRDLLSRNERDMALLRMRLDEEREVRFEPC